MIYLAISKIKGGFHLSGKTTLKSQLSTFYKYRFLVKELVSKNIKLQYRNSVLGMFWTFLQPLLTMIVLAVIFNNIFGRDSSKVVNYPVFLLSGRLLHEFFTSSTKSAMKSIRARASIIKKVYVPKYVYPLSAVLSKFVTFVISLTVLVAVIIYFNLTDNNPITLTGNLLWAIPPVAVLFFFSLGVGLILATMNVFFKDIENIYDVFCLLLFYITPIVYTADHLGYSADSTMGIIIRLNPMFGFIEMFRGAVIHGAEFYTYFDMNLFYYCCGVTAVVLVAGLIMFHRSQDKFILHI
ncbi:MAG: ABC transporter permease [Clostridia bacterium]|nr:ABC transporter permease [Clostridia bacterium]